VVSSLTAKAGWQVTMTGPLMAFQQWLTTEHITVNLSMMMLDLATSY